MTRALSFALAVALVVAAPHAAAPGQQTDALDKILDTYVRDGLVYYRALKMERAALDRVVASLDVPEATIASWPAAARHAFWINAYNALVLKTVVDAYPIPRRSELYPAGSIRQIPGAFDRVTHRVGGRQMTLDGIEAHLVETTGDARVLFALGRGAIGSSRLRSEAWRADRLETQLDEAVKECAARLTCIRIDPSAGTLSATPIIGWHEAAVIRTFLPSGTRWPNRAPIERATAAMVFPNLFSAERDLLESGTFRMSYHEFDWRLNDLTGR